jgi:hypothetical protein
MVLVRKKYNNEMTAVREGKNTVLIGVLAAFFFICTFIYSYASTTIAGNMNWGVGGNMTVSQSLGFTDDYTGIIVFLSLFLFTSLYLFHIQGLSYYDFTWVFPVTVIIGSILIGSLIWITTEKEPIIHVIIAFIIFIGVQLLLVFTVYVYWNSDTYGNSKLRLRSIVGLLLFSIIIFIALIISFVRSYNEYHIYALNIFALMEVTMIFTFAFWIITIGWYPPLKYKKTKRQKHKITFKNITKKIFT